MDRYGKSLTHRYERLQGRQQIRSAVAEMQQYPAYYEDIWEPTQIVEMPDGSFDVV